MRKSKFSEEQFIGFLKQAEAGLAVAEICRKGGFSDATFYKWRAKFGGMQASDARRLRELEAQNAKLKSLLAEAHLDMHVFKSVLEVKRSEMSFPKRLFTRGEGRWRFSRQPAFFRTPRMNIHKNASLTPKGRAHLMQEIDRIGLVPAAAAAGISTRTARKWLRRHAAEGAGGLIDRSSRPRRSPRRSLASKLERAVALRRTQRLSYERIAERVGLSRSTVARACKAAGVARLPALQQAVPVRRYERAAPGELLHLDTKKLARFDRPGHRVTGDRTQNTRHAGWQALHVAIDDHSRVGFSLVLADETAKSACTFVLAALRYYKSLGVKIEQVMTDNGSAYNSRRFAKLLRRLGIRHIRTRPYTPRTNGKAERFIQTLLREWAYAFVYPSSELRARELAPWMYHYNFNRPHSATSGKPPITRLGFDGNNVVRNYN